MKCPLCNEDIAVDAIRCSHCKADLKAIRSFLSRIGALEARLEEVAKDMDTIRTRLFMKRPSTKSAPRSVGVPDQATDTTPLSRENTATQRWWFAILAPVTVLAALHAFLIVLLQASYQFLVVSLIVVPAPFALYYAISTKERVGSFKLLILGLATGLAAAAAMSISVYLWEGSSPFPQGKGELRQLTLAVLAIGLSILAGGLLGRLLNERAQSAIRHPGHLEHFLGMFLLSNQSSDHRDQQLANFHKRVELLAAIVSIAASCLSAIGSS